jgi:hypothetical protein
MTSHENYEKRSLNMEYSSSGILISLQKALENPDVMRVADNYTIQKLIFVKDYLPDGTPCWRLPTQEEINEFNKEKTKDEI